MKAAIWYGGKDIRIEDVPKPEIRSDEVLVEVKAVGICGSELHAYEGISKRRRPPLIMGHEFSGVIAEIGGEVEGFKKGDRVVVDPLNRCGVCEQCTAGRGNICRNVKLLGLHVSGAFAEYVPAPARNCYKLPDHVSFEEGSVVEPLSVGVHAVNRTPIKLGDTVLVVGAGVIG
ncbi:galactitol-1-phosphate 5-dehydrogenase, partial [Candidatus Bathyarchaeota archaeon]